MEQIERITLMEKHLNEGAAAVRELGPALARYQSAQEDLRSLSDYYGGGEWRRDLEDDEAGKLPTDLRRGVLSEDAVYDLLAENRELLVQMLETACQAVALNLR